MCGIAGIVTTDRLTDGERVAVGWMRDILTHRGPDEAGAYFDAQAGLGHRRLSIVDVSGAGQPVRNETGTIRLLLNGQIYNHAELRRDLAARGHAFATQGDAEVLVHLYEQYGDDFLHRARGMFALAIWDAPRRRLLLARDRLGVKPLYYRVESRRLLFGSELKSLLEAPGIPRELDLCALADYLALGFIPAPRTIFRGIEKLEAGACLVFERGAVRKQRYWSLPAVEWHTGTADSLADELWSRLADAARERLSNEVSFGALFSGGIDSAAVVAAMIDAAGPATSATLPTCTIGSDAAVADERAPARLAAQRLGANYHDCCLTSGDLSQLARLAWHLDEPLADPSALPMFLLARNARMHMKVALTGDGGDEILAGYRRYRFDRYEEQLRRAAPEWMRRALLAPAARIAPDAAWLPRPLRARRLLVNLAGDGAAAHARSVARMEREQVLELLHPDLRRTLGDYDPLEQLRAAYHDATAADPLARCQAVDIRFGLADGILAKADRTSMAHGLEVRSPMLDHRFVEFAAGIPPALRVRGAFGKLLLRQAAARRLGHDLAWQRKRGFGVPLDEWLMPGAHGAKQLAGWLRRNDHGLINRAAIQRLWTDHQSGRRRHGATLWSLAMLSAWSAQFLPAADRGLLPARPRMNDPTPRSAPTSRRIRSPERDEIPI